MRQRVRMRSMWVLAIAAAVLGLAVLAAGCGGDDETAAADTAAPATEAETTEAAATEEAPATTEADTGTADTGAAPASDVIQQPGQCGAPDGQGQPASGEPIKIGAIVQDVPGVVFSPITNATKAYFDCVNDNGGIGGRPIEYIVINDQGDGNAARQAAVTLWEEEGVLGFAGSTSFVECTVNHEYYEQNDIYAIVAGASAECFNTPNIAAVNQGPYYSTSTATDYAIRERGAQKIVCARANTPGAEFQCGGAAVLAEQAGIPFEEVPVDVPISDPASLVVRLAQQAGENGGVLPGFTEDQLLPFLQAVEQQGLIDRAIWFAGATGSTSTLIQQLAPEWDGVWFAQSEFAVPETGTGPDTVLFRDIMAQYAPNEPLGNFGEMGFLSGRFMTEALLRVAASGEELTKESVNAAVRDLINIPTDVLCKPWYFGDLPSHLPNNGSLFTTPDNGKAVPLTDECYPDPMTDPIIAQAYLDEITLGIPQLPGTPTQAEIEEYLASGS